jgi:hypothetical protein
MALKYPRKRTQLFNGGDVITRLHLPIMSKEVCAVGTFPEKPP